MPTCFVMQPFDKDKFDKRFTDVFAPAIKGAGLTPYRVDQDPTVEIPIEDIERGIREAEVCFAEITTDNPNVWFELGYAIAAGKPVCMVCSKERTTPFPFDVRHRVILTYEVGSTSDFQSLSLRVTERLQALIRREANEKTIESLQPTSEMAGLTPHEVTALAIVVGGSAYDHEFVSIFQLKESMERAGFTELAAGLSIRSLAQKRLVEIREVGNNWNDESFNACYATDAGVNWMLKNQDQLILRIMQKPTAPHHDGVPF